MASKTITPMTIMDAIATLSLRSRRQVSCHWLRPSTACTGALSTADAWSWISVILMGLPPGSGFGGEVLARLDREVAGGQVGGRVACLDLKRRVLLTAQLLRLRAPGMEPAAGGRIDG